MKYFAFIISFLLFTPITLAMPSLSNQCGEKGKSFIPPKNTTLVAFDEECDTAFIGPPANGRLQLDQIMENTNLLFCKTVKLLPQTIEAARQGIQFWVERIAKKSETYDEIVKTVNGHAKKLSELKPMLESKAKLLEKYQENVFEIRKKAIELRRQHNDCKITDNDEKCDDIHNELKKELLKLNNERARESELELIIMELEFQIKRESNKLEEINGRMEKLSADLEKFKRLLKDLETDALDGYERYGQLHGATATVNLHADWSKLIHEAQNKNAGFYIQQLPLIGSKVDITVGLPQGFGLQSMSSILGARIPGFDNFIDITNKEPRKMDLGRELSLNSMPIATTMGGQIDFNLLGACIMTDETGHIRPSIAQKKIGAQLVVNIQHTYPLMMKRNYEVTFNAKKIISEMEKLTESSGFLSSKKIHSLVKNNFTKEKFNINFYDEGGRNEFSKEEKEQIRTDAKYEIVDRILQEVNAIPQYGDESPALPRLDRSSGVRFVHHNLPCFGYPVCQAVGFIFGVVDAIFGNKEAVSSFKKVNETNITHRYNEVSPSYKTITATFSGTGQ
jgi:hypothetical protein